MAAWKDVIDMLTYTYQLKCNILTGKPLLQHCCNTNISCVTMTAILFTYMVSQNGVYAARVHCVKCSLREVFISS